MAFVSMFARSGCWCGDDFAVESLKPSSVSACRRTTANSKAQQPRSADGGSCEGRASRKNQANRSAKEARSRTHTSAPRSRLPLVRGAKRRLDRIKEPGPTLEAEAIEKFKATKTIPEFRPAIPSRSRAGRRRRARRIQEYEGVCIARANRGMGSASPCPKTSAKVSSASRFIRRTSNRSRSFVAVFVRSPSFIICAAAPANRRLAEHRDPRPHPQYKEG